MTAKLTVLSAALALAACGSSALKTETAEAALPQQAGTWAVVHDSTIAATIEAHGIANPFAQATLSTKLMGSVSAVLVREGENVAAGQVLVRLDARDVDAHRAQSAAGIAAADAALRNAQSNVKRVRALFADSAAPRAMLDNAEMALAQAAAGANAAKAGADEVDALRDYAVLRAPFAGVIVRRMVDVGAFVAPGAPIMQMQDASRLRLTVTVAPAVARAVRVGATLEAAVDGRPAHAIVEGVVPSATGGVWQINAIVANGDQRLSAGSSTTLFVASGDRHALLVPEAAIIRQGELTGVRVRSGAGSDLRWVKVGRAIGSAREVLSGLQGTESILIVKQQQSMPGADK